MGALDKFRQRNCQWCGAPKLLWFKWLILCGTCDIAPINMMKETRRK